MKSFATLNKQFFAHLRIKSSTLKFRKKYKSCHQSTFVCLLCFFLILQLVVIVVLKKTSPKETYCECSIKVFNFKGAKILGIMFIDILSYK